MSDREIEDGIRAQVEAGNMVEVAPGQYSMTEQGKARAEELMATSTDHLFMFAALTMSNAALNERDRKALDELMKNVFIQLQAKDAMIASLRRMLAQKDEIIDSMKDGEDGSSVE